jgi:acyl-CoA reductase-like NAD-dependent aldehyde dehydrogenase
VVGGRATGQALAAAGLDQLWLTGSVRAGLSVQAAMGLHPVELELGGNSAAIICDDAPLETTIAGVVWGATYNAGQSCSGIKRVLVQRAIAEPFITGVVRAVQGLRAGRDYGPLIRAGQRDQAVERIAQAERDGAERLTGGTFPDGLSADQQQGYWLSPCVLRLAHPHTPLVQEETFANVVPILIVDDDAAAIAIANDTVYGLSASVWSGDVARAARIAEQLQAGMVFINEVEVALMYGEAWRGWKQSGIAGAGSKLERCFKQQLTVLHTGTAPRPYWFPY